MSLSNNTLEFYGFEYNSKSGILPPVLTKQHRIFRYFLLAINILFFVFSCVLIGVGVNSDHSSATTLTGNTLPKALIVLGVFLLLLSFLGLLAVYKQIRTLLIIYFILILLITILLLAIGITLYAARAQSFQWITSGWNQAIANNDNDPSKSTLIVSIQQSFNCCGLYDASTAADQCPNNTKEQQIYCAPKLNDFIQSTYYSGGACGIAFAIIMSCCLAGVIILLKGIQKKNFVQQRQEIHRKLREEKSNDDDVIQMHQITLDTEYTSNAFQNTHKTNTSTSSTNVSSSLSTVSTGNPSMRDRHYSLYTADDEGEDDENHDDGSEYHQR